MSSSTDSSAPGRPAFILLAAAPGHWPALADHLREAGHRIVHVDTADAAVERALADDVDLLLVDAALGGIGAAAAADILRRLGRALRLVALDERPVADDPSPFDERLHAASERGALDAVVRRAVQASEAAFVEGQAVALAEAVAALSGDFEASLPALREAILSALAARDVRALRSACHRLRGGAGAFGHVALAEQAARVERAADEGRDAEAMVAGRGIVDHPSLLAAGAPAAPAPEADR